MVRNLFLLLALSAAPLAFAGDISGFWKHAEEPAWIEIRLDEGKGTVLRNDKFPERVGRDILKDLVAEDSEQGRWKGHIYAGKPGEYKERKSPWSNPISWPSRSRWALLAAP